MSAGRIEARFAALAAERRAGLVTYVMAGDPTPQASLEILKTLTAAGADLIELGLPFSDPMADGPTIQKAAVRALERGMTTRATLDLVAAFRRTDAATPVILMGYLNPVMSFGLKAFATAAAEAGVDGLIMVDCPPEEADALSEALDAQDIALIRLATPTTDATRLQVVARGTRGFVYYVSVAGVTGDKAAEASRVAPAVAQVRAASGLPVAVGFGVREPEQAADIARVADAVVVGSALVEVIAAAAEAGADPAEAVSLKARALAGAVHAARQEPALG
jgi:tryptophan synthase alpha chain